MADVRFMAEWEGCDAILMAWPDQYTDWDYMLDTIQPQYISMITAFINAGEHVVLLVHDKKLVCQQLLDIDSSHLTIVEADYNDTWTRDYGPLSVIRDERLRALDFGFNAWGSKFAADKDNLVNLTLKRQGIISNETYRNERDFILEGGSIESDGIGTILTTSQCLCSENRNGGKTKSELTEILNTRLGAKHILWLDYGALQGDDTDSHIDTLARICPNNTIAFTGCRNVDDSQFEDLLKMRAQLTLFRNIEGEPYNLLELPLPSPIFDDEGNRLPATYANYLVTSKNLFMPVYDDEQNDILACQTIRIAYPEHNIVPINSKALVFQHGSLHCATMQIPKNLFTLPI